MSAAMPREKRDRFAFEATDDERVGRIAERSPQAPLARVLETGNAIEAAAADDADRGAGNFALVFARRLGIRRSPWPCAEVTAPGPERERAWIAMRPVASGRHGARTR